VRTTIRLVAAVLVASLAVTGAGCSGDDDPAGSDAPTTTGAAPGDDGSGDGDDGSGDGDPAEDGGADEVPADLGWQISGAPGTVVQVVSTGTYAGDEQQPLEQTVTIGDEPAHLLFTGFIESATVEVTVTEGGPVVVEGLRGRAADPENPFGGIVVVEVLVNAEVGPGETATIAFP
jgi:hypothetical protein